MYSKIASIIVWLISRTCAILVASVLIIPLVSRDRIVYEKMPTLPDEIGVRFEVIENVNAVFTAFNSVEEQTDGSPCVSANGMQICGRKDILACPRKYSFGTLVKIENRIFICADRLRDDNPKRFDWFYDKDIEGARQFGVRSVPVEIVRIVN